METPILIFTLTGAVLNRFSGWTDYLPGRNIYWATLIAFLMAWETIGLGWATAIAISMLTYRLPGWNHSLDMGTYGDSLARDFKVMFVRSMFILPVFGYAFYLNNNPFILFGCVIGALGATLSYGFGNYVMAKYMKDPFWVIEPLAGAFIGAAIGQAYVLAV